MIQPFDVPQDVTVRNGQPATEEFIVFSDGLAKLASNLNAITETMTQQTRREIAKNGRAAAGKPKAIELKVYHLVGRQITFRFWGSEMRYQAKLGNGETIEKLVTHRSASQLQDLNGCIAESVLLLLRDEKVLAYLANSAT